ncbi:hypothetical protein LINPERPRIM_LOCUS21488, partial [Linum perenne]
MMSQFVSQSQTQPQSASGSAPVVPPVVPNVDDIFHWFEAPDVGPDFIQQLAMNGGGGNRGGNGDGA